jgi:type III pantothenate kinase
MMICNLFSLHGRKHENVTGIAISCVVPPLLPVIEEVGRRYFQLRPLVVGPGVKTGMPIFYDNPAEVGADRIVNAVAAYERHKGEVLVVDFGTATTFDYVSARGEYIGGAIVPGVGIATEALFQRASKLPRVELVNPGTVIGKNTVHVSSQASFTDTSVWLTTWFNE